MEYLDNLESGPPSADSYDDFHSGGLRRYQPKETEMSIVSLALEEFVAHHKKNATLPTPEEVNRNLIPQIKHDIDTHNQCASRSRKLIFTHSLVAEAIAGLLLGLFPFARISLGHVAQKDTDLGMYISDGEEKGTYTVDESAIRSFIRDYCAGYGKSLVDEVMYILSLKAPIKRRNTDPELIAVNNGIFDRKKKELLPFSSEHVFLSKIVTDYNPNAENVYIVMPDGKSWDCESQMASFSDDDEITSLMWAIVAAAVRPLYPWSKAILPYSVRGNNGKGTLMELIRSVLGPKACCAVTLKQFGDPFGCEPLLTAQVVLADENGVGAYLDSNANFKAAVTHDVLPINRKYKSVIPYKFDGVIIECINELPRFQDRSASLLRRILIVPFEKCFTGIERKYIKEDYLHRKEVREYYLKRALELEVDELPEPKACQDLLRRFRNANDALHDFFDEVVMGYSAWNTYPLTFVYEHYKSWHARSCPSGKPLSSRKFKEELGSLISESDCGLEYVGPDTTVRVRDGDMAGHEQAIIDFELESYMNKSYKGSDPEKICNFKRPETVRGCLRRLNKDEPRDK